MENKVVLKYDCQLYDELSVYLLSVNGIINVNIDNGNGIVDIVYNSDKVNEYMISKEIDLYLQIDKIPSLIGFEKYNNIVLNKYDIIIKDLCCEYCLKGYIKELLMIDGIKKVYTDFDYVNKDNVIINVFYDYNSINLEEIIELEKKFN